MFSESILRAKLIRGGIAKLEHTKLLEESSLEANDTILMKLFLDDDETPLSFYSDNKGYNWILTNRRLLFPFNLNQILLKDIRVVNVDNVLNEVENKLTNNEIDIIIENQENHKIFVEEKSWPLIYNVLRFVASKNQSVSE